MGIVSMTGLDWLCYVVAFREYFFEEIRQPYTLLCRIAHILILMGFEYWCLYISYGDCWLMAKYTYRRILACRIKEFVANWQTTIITSVPWK